jgi:hypothetical protein
VSPQRFRPTLASRVILLAMALPCLALSIAAWFYAPLLGIPLSLVMLYATVFAAFRMFHPRAYMTEISDEGFRVHNWTGRLIHDLRWSDLGHLTVLNANGLRGPGTMLCVAWRCQPRRRTGRRFAAPGIKGGRTPLKDEFDGALPDGYIGIEPMLEIFREHVGGTRAVPAPPQALRL